MESNHTFIVQSDASYRIDDKAISAILIKRAIVISSDSAKISSTKTLISSLCCHSSQFSILIIIDLGWLEGIEPSYQAPQACVLPLNYSQHVMAEDEGLEPSRAINPSRFQGGVLIRPDIFLGTLSWI